MKKISRNHTVTAKKENDIEMCIKGKENKMKIAIVTGAVFWEFGASYVCQLAEKYSWAWNVHLGVIARNETATLTLQRQCIVPLRCFMAIGYLLQTEIC